MSIEIKKSNKFINYDYAMNFLEKRVIKIHEKRAKEILWVLEHPNIYTAGTSYKNNEIFDKNLKIIKSNRGGKITWHGPGQKVFYFVIDLNKRKKDIRNFVNIIEESIIDTLFEYNIKSFADRKNIGIWTGNNNNAKKIAAIGLKVKRWIAYHGFCININNKLDPYKKISPCGLENKKISSLMKVKKQNYKDLSNKLIKNFLKNLEK